ncbi:ATG16 autophagy related 16-like 2 isoform X2 [Cynoglossus semilaevis]|uniref:ATG16 autophagy related 16-like 2 isoform X2 n=1 Tax=Cynoglossus semilaevis TaxID=244447 RepID=UPI0007DC8971|nr:autophagy-related protein 16-2 isoform X2 [Cynoglossus semilaevis]
MAAATVTSRASERSGRVLAPGGDTWKRHIVRQLKYRDQNQHAMFQDLIRFYTQLLDKSSLTKGILNLSARRPCSDSNSLSAVLQQKNQLKKTTGELAYQVVELQQQIKIKECVLEEQSVRLQEEQQQLSCSSDTHQLLQKQVNQGQQENRLLEMTYDDLLERQREAESRLREEKLKEGHLLEDMIHLKRQAAARMNSRNERKSRAREANLQKKLLSGARSEVTVDSSSAPTSRSTSPEKENQIEWTERQHTRLFRSSSATSLGIITSIRGLFHKKRRGHSVCSLDEDLMCPVGTCVSARVPVRALQVLEAHDQSINTVRFSSSSDLVATGGTDRVIKVWDIRAGSLTHTATLEGSNEGITCVEFDPTGSRVLAASYDKSALLWRLDDSIPKLTLTGHSRKVTAARFSGFLHHVVTGSADRTIRLWDLHRAACVQVVEVSSFCSDLVCSENCIISGHYDSKIRVWDTRVTLCRFVKNRTILQSNSPASPLSFRAVNCVQEFPAQGKVTSLDLSSDHRQLLSCCRDDCLQLVDLRRGSNERLCFRADGFTCGSDSTKAVIRSVSVFVFVFQSRQLFYSSWISRLFCLHLECFFWRPGDAAT